MTPRIYPYRGRSQITGLEVRFTSHRTGTVVKVDAGPQHYIGQTASSWAEAHFTPIPDHDFDPGNQTLNAFMAVHNNP